jgi:hypothetical protein
VEDEDLKNKRERLRMELTGLETEPASLEPALDAVCTRAPVHEKQMKVLYQGFAFIKGGVLSKLEGVSRTLGLENGVPVAFERLCKLEQGGGEAPGYASKMA